MKKVGKVILVTLGIIIDLAAIYMIMLSLKMVPLMSLVSFLGFLANSEAYMLIGLTVFIAGMVFIIFGAGLKTETKEKVDNMGSRQNRYTVNDSVRLTNTLGEILVSFQAIENLVLRASRNIQGIRETRTQIKNSEQGLVLSLWVNVIPEQGIPQLVEHLQEEVKNYVAEKAGTPVAEVKVMVENVIVSGLER